MDTTSPVTHIGLCAGYGGIELGLKRVIPHLRTVALCEIEAFAVANLVAKMEAGLMDPAPIWPDLKTFPYESFHGRVDILTGGYPCQPFSSAGKRLGSDDPRHLWPHIARGIRLLRPKLCFFENVEGHITLGLPDVIEDLARMGYRSAWGIFSAAEVGAPHQRKRVFILAYRDSERRQLPDWWRVATEQMPVGNGTAGGDAWPSRPGEQQHGWEPPRVVTGRQALDDTQERCLRDDSDNQRQTVGEIDTAYDSGSRSGEAMGDTGCQRQEERQLPTGGPEQSDQNVADASIIGSDGRTDGISWRIRQPREAGGDAAGWRSEGNGMRQTEPSLGGDADGLAGGLDYAELCVSGDNRTDELRLLGNGVVPATAALAFRTLLREVGHSSPRGDLAGGG